jgi:succinate dehydrogenase/fumarate reductase flavoprotein subunit
MDADTFDVVVVGTGAGGLSAALAAHEAGVRTAILEASSLVGGTHAYATGLIWVPANDHELAAGIDDSPEEAIAHVRELSGDRHDEEVLGAFAHRSAEAIRWLEQHAEVPFELVPRYPDYYAERIGGKAEGRYLASPLFRCPELLPDEWQRRLVRSPYYSALAVSWREIQTWGGFGSIATWDKELLMRRAEEGYVGFGMATAGYLLAAVLKRQIPVLLETKAVGLVQDKGRITGLRVRAGKRERVIAARLGVVLATGGYDRSARLQKRLDPHPVARPLGAPEVDGAALEAALELGAAFAVMDGQLLLPTYQIPRADGAAEHRTLIRESAFPGCLIVNASGQRFCDESFYRGVAHAMAQFDVITQSYPNRSAYLVFDQEWKDRYPLGPIRAGDIPDWLTRADDPRALANSIHVEADNFSVVLDEYNAAAEIGEDPTFGRGSLAYGRNNGDPTVGPNPCLRQLSGRLFAVRLELGTAGTNNGLVVDSKARVLHVRGEPIPGLYAVGNTAANLVEGLWYNSGTANARGLTFGYVAALDLAEAAHQ